VTSNIMREVVVDSGIHAIDTMAEKSNRRSTCRQRTAVCGGIDALSEPADDTETGPGEVPGELECVLRASLRRVTAADDRESRQVQNLRVADDEQPFRRSRNAGQQFGVTVISESQQVVVLLL